MRLQRLIYDLRTFATRKRRDAILDDEIAFHIEQQAAQNERFGMPPDEALRAARATFGRVPATKEAFRDVSGFSLRIRCSARRSSRHWHLASAPRRQSSPC